MTTSLCSYLKKRKLHTAMNVIETFGYCYCLLGSVITPPLIHNGVEEKRVHRCMDMYIRARLCMYMYVLSIYIDVCVVCAHVCVFCVHASVCMYVCGCVCVCVCVSDACAFGQNGRDWSVALNLAHLITRSDQRGQNIQYKCKVRLLQWCS